MNNIHVLPIDKPSRLFEFMSALVLTERIHPNDSGSTGY